MDREVKGLFKNLRNALFARGLTLKSYAEFLGVTEKTIHNKLNGISEFTLSEVERTTRILFPEYKWEYLFKTDGDTEKAG